jgi:phenylpropionate dioxygenase-like ring-hydroxylating dioxygenase large terminal subunit
VATAETRSGGSVPTIDQALEDGWTLPAAWYSDATVAALERERIFERSWQYACPAVDVATPGSFAATQAGHVPVVVTRNRDDELRAFVNVCRHRGHIVAKGAGCRETLQCPYHAWTYELDGSLRRAPRSEREVGFDPASFSLLPVAVDTWGPFVFVNPDVGAAPLAETLGELPAIVARSGLELDALRFHSHHEWPIEANWKLTLENYLECYHCPVAHPGFSKVIDVDPDEYALSVSPTFSSQIGPIRASALAGRGTVPYVPTGDVKQSQYHFVWPNTTINIAPGPQNIAIERWVPDGVGRTIEVTDYWFGADVADDVVQEVLAFDEQVGIEDVDLVLSVQAGLGSGMVPQGRLMRESEQLIADFQRKLCSVVCADAGSPSGDPASRENP